MMQSVIRKIGRAEEDAVPSEQEEILYALFDAKDRLDTAFSVFNSVCDPELVEACIFEINALQSRYAYFLSRARQAGLTAEPTFKKRPRYL